MTDFVNLAPLCPLPEKINHPLHQFKRKSSWKIHAVLNQLEIPGTLKSKSALFVFHLAPHMQCK